MTPEEIKLTAERLGVEEEIAIHKKKMEQARFEYEWSQASILRLNQILAKLNDSLCEISIKQIGGAK